MDAAVVELNTLADPVGTAAQDHDLGLVRADFIGVCRVISGVIISAVLCTGNMHAVPCFLNADADPSAADLIFGYAQDLGQILIGKAVFLGLCQHLVGQALDACRHNGLFLFHQFLHLLDEIFLDVGQIIDLIHGRALAKGFIHDEMALAAGCHEELEQITPVHLVIVLDMPQTVAVFLQRTDRLLEGLLIGLADGHDFADSAHLGAQLVLYAPELLKGPAGELDDDIVSVRNIFIQCTVLAAGDIGQAQAGGQHGGYQGDRESCCLGSQGRGPGSTGVDLNNDDTVGLGIMGELYVGAADDLDLVYDPVGLLLQTVHDLLGDSQHGSGTEGVSCMNTHRVYILDEADGDHVAVLVADDFQLQLFPAHDRFFYQDLSDQRSLQAAGTDDLELISVIDQTAAGAAHGISGTKDDRIAQFIRDGKGLFHTVSDFGAGHGDADALHCLFEFNTVFTAFDGIDLYADDLYIIFVEDSGLAELRAQVQSGLTAQIRKQRVGALLGDNLFQSVYVQRFDICYICHLRIRHDGRGI